MKFKVGDEIYYESRNAKYIHKIYDKSGTHYFYEVWIEEERVNNHSFPIDKYEVIEDGEVMRKLTKLDKALK